MYQGSFSHDPTGVLWVNQKSFLGLKKSQKELYFQDFQRVIAKSVIALEATEANLRKNWKQMVGNAAGGSSI